MNGAPDLHRFTRAFPGFLGLRLVPMGLWFLLVPLVAPFTDDSSTTMQAVLLLAAAVATWRIHAWYRETLGVVMPERLSLGRNWGILAGLGCAGLVFALGAQRLGGVALMVSVLVLVLFAAAAMFALRRVANDAVLVVSVVVGVVVLAVLLLLAAGRDPIRFSSLGALWSLAVGATLCASGIVEHRMLMRDLEGLRMRGND